MKTEVKSLKSRIFFINKGARTDTYNSAPISLAVYAPALLEKINNVTKGAVHRKELDSLIHLEKIDNLHH